MDFFEKIEYTEKDLRELISSQAEESIHLDFKAAGALDKTNEKRAEIAKDVSAFANSDGGIIVYGITEENHVASNFSFIEGNEYTKEWLERVINDGIQRRVLGIQISPIRVNGDIKKLCMLSRYLVARMLLICVSKDTSTIDGTILNLYQWKIMRLETCIIGLLSLN